MNKKSKSLKSEFPCSICNQTLSSRAHLTRHISLTHSTKDFICDYDGKHFNTKDKLRLHVYQHRKLFVLKCRVCGNDYKTNQSMRKHLRTHFQKHQCQHCGQVFGYKRLLENHVMAIHEEIQEVQCRFCTRLFTSTTTRDSHIKLVHKDQTVDTKKFRCTECPAGFEMREELRIHTFIHFQGEIHHCFECNQIFKKKKLLNHHMKKHQTPGFSCETCGTMFKYNTNLHKHLKKGRCVKVEKKEVDYEKEAKIAYEQFVEITTNFAKSILDYDEVKKEKEEAENVVEVKKERKRKVVKEEPEEAPLIEIKRSRVSGRVIKSSPKAQKFLKHPSPPPDPIEDPPKRNRIAKPSDDYQCDLCPFTCIKKSQILSHIRHHVSSNRHKCKSCFETFTSIEKLHKHSLKVHKTGVFGSLEYSKENIKCEHCDKIFSAERFPAHMNLHQTPKFQCDFCGVLFRTKQACERHMRSRHETDRLVPCPTCGKSYKKTTLKQHEETHNPFKIYMNCEICGKFMQMKNLKLHVEMKHGNRYKDKNCICECGKAFRYMKQLQKHIDQVHVKVGLGRVYECPDCDFTSTRLSELRAHSFEHYTGTVFECFVCGLKFKTKKLLQIHSKVHSMDAREYKCRFCESVFQTSGGRRKHETKVHEGQEEVTVQVLE